MASYSWSFDVATGVFKNNFISKKTRFAAIIDTIFQQFVKPADDAYGKGKGDTVNLRRLRNLAVPTTAALTENIKIPIDPFSTSSRAITVIERGRGVEYTSFAKDLETFDLENGVQKKLRDQLKVVLDNAAAAAFTSSDVKVIAIPTGLSAITWDTDGTPSTAATVNLTLDHLGIIRDCLRTMLDRMSASCSPLLPSCGIA